MSARRRIVVAVCLLVLAPAVVWGAQLLRFRTAPPHGVGTDSIQATITPAPTASPTASLQTPSPPAAMATPPAVPSGSPRPPAQATASVLWGLWEPHWQTNGTTDITAYTRVEAELGHRADLIHWYANWDEGWDYDGGLVSQVI
jgi:hypothetical protein